MYITLMWCFGNALPNSLDYRELAIFFVSLTGASVAQLASMSRGRGTQLKSCVFSLCMTDDDLLVVPRYADKEICYYKLVTQDN